MEKIHSRVKGFTLIELMITVAIIAIIAAIAYPSYQNSIVKSNRTEAKACLLELAQFMERFYTQNGRYDINRNNVAVALPNLQCRNSQANNYNFQLVVANNALAANRFTLEAAPVAGSVQAARDNCGTLSVNQTGQRGAAQADCW